ncbi:MAG: S8 family serine peptidase, partial [Kangiellaceae bacterium]|nr:S8 family serine peptidase [Kangiellaceae bacterium]
MKAKTLFLTTVMASSISAVLADSVEITKSSSLTIEPNTGINIIDNIQPDQNRYIVKFKDTSAYTKLNSNGVAELNAKQAIQNIKKVGGDVKLTMVQNKAVAAVLSSAAKRKLEMDPNVLLVEKDHPRYLMAQTQPYGIGMVQADQVSDAPAAATAGGKKVCVIDSGLDLPHEDFGAQNGTITGTNNSGTGNWHDQGGPHGTHVAGTIAALNNGLGVRGVIGSDPSMHIIKVFNASGWGYTSSLVSAIERCADAGSDVVNMSLGGGGSSATEASAMQNLYNQGVLLIAAAGNDGNPNSTTDALSYPASYDAVMSVAAIDSSKALADFSQKNSQVEIAAPGVDVYSTYPTGTGSVIELSVGSTAYEANAMENDGSATGDLFNFGIGDTTNSGASGKVCLIQRGSISFYDKVRNCESSGGIGAVLYNNAAGSFGGTLGTSNDTSIPAVTVSDTAGAQMLGQLGQTTSINIGAGNYGNMSGTSMASPHVAGVATLVWSHHPTCTAQEIRNVLNVTAEDLGSAGRDVAFGYGLVQTKDAIDYIAANGCDGQGSGGGGGGTPPPADNVLTNGQTESNLNATTGSELFYTMEVPAGATDLSFVMAGGSGDADLYVRFGSKPTTSAYDCRPYRNGNTETCDISNVQAGTYHVMVRAYSSFSGVNLTGSFTEASGGGGGAEGGSASLTNLSGSRGAWDHYTLEIPAGMSTFTVAMGGGSGDADLYVRFGAQPTTSAYDCPPYRNGNNETCNISNPQAGTWHISIRGYSAYSGVN